MSINTVVNTGINNGRRDITPVYSLPQSVTATPYTRPADWLAMPTVLSTDQKVVLLVAVENVSTNFFAVTCTTSAGTYTINWGDGTSDNVTASNTTTYHNFDWNNVSSGTLTTKGYRQVIVTITPTSGNLLTCSFAPTYVGASGAVTSQWNNKILESIIAGSNITSFAFAGTQISAWMEQSTVLSLSSTANLASSFANCRSLQNIVSFPNGNYTNMSSMFSSCQLLATAPLFTWGTGSVNLTNMFNNCNSLISVPLYDTSTATTMSGMFQGCWALPTVPFFNTQNVTDMSSMFINCISLTSIPPFNTQNVLNMSAMFQLCSGIKYLPTFNTIKVTNISSMLNGCQSLLIAPPFNLVACTNASTLFSTCVSLVTTPPYNLPVCTSIGSMFINCYSLINIGTLTTGTALVSMAQTFTQCRSLINAPIITNTTNVSNMGELFYGCYALQSVPVYDTANVVVLNGMFGLTYSLKTAPAINTIKSTNWQGLFNTSGIITAPSWNSSNVTDMNTCFIGAASLTTIPTYDTRKVTNMTAMFQSTPSLLEIPYMNTINVTNFSSFAQSSGVRQVNQNFDTSNALNISGIFTSCTNLVMLPTFECNKVTTTGSMFSSSPGLSKVNVANLRVSGTVSSCNLGKSELEQLMQGLIRITGAQQTLTVGPNPGADTAVTKTSINFTANSNVVPMANTVGLSTGMIMNQLANINSNIASTFTGANSTVTLPMQLPDNTLVSFSSVTSSNVLANTIYYTEYFSGSAPSVGHRLKLTPAGSTILMTGGTGTARIEANITAINTNSNIILNYAVSNTAGSQSPSFRILNTNYGTFLGWAISG